jgi:hypothetical protein
MSDSGLMRVIYHNAFFGQLRAGAQDQSINLTFLRVADHSPGAMRYTTIYAVKVVTVKMAS